MLDPSGPCHCDALILGCTELSVLNEAFPMPQLPHHRRPEAVLVQDHRGPRTSPCANPPRLSFWLTTAVTPSARIVTPYSASAIDIVRC